ncbi:hypothetical protein NP233_g5957 [Leucocoprinus birnbaumii]|uniref:Eukaryotic translation initiation factor 4E n=1 Tax=Leucocoprinus birnbaumii TaxID=56174 RepID=A0AAD5VRY3_9AGAR|nr:hypothetical protein NP233_g5957 [Leucocoprinus birnbaumii]
MASTLPPHALQASRAALNAAFAEQSQNNDEIDDLEPGEIQEVDMEAQAEGIRTVFSDPKNFNVKHPLYSPWTLWFDSPATKGRNLPQTPVSAFPQTPVPQTPGVAAAQGWMEDIKRVISFDSVEEFWGLYNNIVPPSQLPQKANYYLFKEGIIPAWEDEANKYGGKWSIQLPRDKNRGNVDKMWLYTMLAAIGETFDPTPEDNAQSLITGVIVSIRQQFYRISIWTRLAPADDNDLRDRVETIGRCFKTQVLGYAESARLAGPLATEVEFMSHKDSEKKGKHSKKITIPSLSIQLSTTIMPVPGFLASFADKAQSAINASPLAGHLPSHNRPNSPDSSAQPSANQAAAQGGPRSHALETLSYQIRSLGQQYSSTTPVQRIITSEKGVALDFDSVSRNLKAQSKELYTWGQSETEDLKDVTDRLAYLNFVQGSLAGTLGTKLDAARSPFKALRDAETAITPRRNIRVGLHNQIGRLEHEQAKGGDKKIAEIRDQLRKAEQDDAEQEREIEILKRKAVRESERLKWEAIREYGEKLVLLSQAATPIIAALPSIPPTLESPYTGAQATGAARASLQRALDDYKTGHINLPAHLTPSELSRSDTQSFGESHASELSTINSPQSALQTSPPPSQISVAHTPPPLASSPQKTSPPLNPATLNLSPAQIPSLAQTPPSAVVPDAAPATSPVPTVTPTVAETGIPVAAGAGGPGPVSGSLHELHQSPSAGPASAAPKYETAEEEKRRLAAAYSQPSTSQAPQAPPAPYESPEEEKKRLEREERERLLAAGSGPQPPSDKKDKDDDLPPYQDI